MKRVLITGANGFVGSHLVSEYLAHGYQVFAGIRKGRSIGGLPSPVQPVFLDYYDVAALKLETEKIRPQIVIHCAGVTVSGRLSDFHEGNVIPTHNLLESLAQMPVERFVLISSLAARGPGENSPDEPVSVYGKSKLQAEQLVRASQFPWNIIRPTAVYGSGDAAFRPLFWWARRGIFPRLGRTDRRLTFVHVQDLTTLIRSECEAVPNRVTYGWDGVVYLQRDVIDAFKAASGRRGFIIPIPGGLFAGITALLDVLIRRLFRGPWAYPPEKMKELLAEDWGIDSAERPTNEMRSIRDGFAETMKSYFP